MALATKERKERAVNEAVEHARQQIAELPEPMTVRVCRGELGAAEQETPRRGGGSRSGPRVVYPRRSRRDMWGRHSDVQVVGLTSLPDVGRGSEGPEGDS